MACRRCAPRSRAPPEVGRARPGGERKVAAGSPAWAPTDASSALGARSRARRERVGVRGGRSGDCAARPTLPLGESRRPQPGGDGGRGGSSRRAQPGPGRRRSRAVGRDKAGEVPRLHFREARLRYQRRRPVGSRVCSNCLNCFTAPEPETFGKQLLISRAESVRLIGERAARAREPSGSRGPPPGPAAAHWDPGAGPFPTPGPRAPCVSRAGVGDFRKPCRRGQSG